MSFVRAASRRMPLAKRLVSAVESPMQRRYVSATLKAQAGVSNNVKGAVVTPDPGADSVSAAFVNERAPYLVPTYVRPAPIMVKGQGCYLWDMENRRYLDLTAGIAVNSLGHCDPEISKIIAEQAETLLHASNLYHNAWVGALSKDLIILTRESGAMRDAAQVFIANSGTEANEAAIKFARKTGRARDPSGAKHEIVSFHNSFHGRTMGALSATPNPKYQTPFSPMLPGFKYGKYNDVAQLKDLVTEKTCGVIVEPIQGEGGVNVATPEFLSALRKRCDDVGAVLIFDEIQCGLSRTGSFWAHAHPSLVPSSGEAAHPDILTTAKALGNGIPIGATIVSGKTVADNIKAGDHGTTFGGNPLACRVAHHIIHRLASPELQKSVQDKSAILVAGFQALQQKYPDLVSEVRGRGLILGLQLSKDFSARAGEIVTAARERGMLIITAGEGCLRFVPPLTITEEQLKTALRILEQAFEAVKA
ncbi:acetylornithine transaminase [Aspergillus nidulans FGSC A4]|uniref:acetylornithine transaminase n=1 Tax=Emericella nidulans (strain FGSC A4 / ATCC 38163 / CBS 112.46 / NRRL 194 / M139) TaxID=227321 RepID=C8VT45_EMENI|nr:acetylornithine transaminase [Aspergillus nidulans FGSC A4]CBF88044.1 TPA: acetylornithine aminotransferase, ornithine transaminase (Eurofung) [Aspergillus nidulans FGSC A4]